MARYDKYNPISGGSRARLAADWAKADEGIPFAVSLDANGRVVKGTAGQSGIFGVLVVDKTASTTIPAKKAGDVVDVMRSGEIVEVAGIPAGTAVYAAATGALSAGVLGDRAVGTTVESTPAGSRLVVDVTKGAKP